VSERGNASAGINFGGVLLVAFIVLKLCGVIGWSWWWVMAPLWMPLAIVLVVLAIVLVVRLCSNVTKRHKGRQT